MKEIITDKSKILKGVNNLANTVLLTMGPNGSTVGYYDDYDRPQVTKDGVTIANKIRFEDPVEDFAAMLIKQAAQKTVDEAGDGTTTSTCLAQAFINQGYKYKDTYESAYLNNELDILLKDILSFIKDNSKKTKKSDILKVARISSNNDNEIAKIINEAYKHSKIVKVEEGGDKDEIELVNGMELPTTYFSKIFINNPAKQTIQYNDCYLIIIDGKLNKIDTVAH